MHENRIYSLKITCGPSYPDIKPDVQFISRVNLPFVDQTNGVVNYNKLQVLSTWSRQSSIETVLVEIRKSVIRHIHFLIWFQVEHLRIYLGRWHHSIIANCHSLLRALPSRIASCSDAAKLNWDSVYKEFAFFVYVSRSSNKVCKYVFIGWINLTCTNRKKLNVK